MKRILVAVSIAVCLFFVSVAAFSAQEAVIKAEDACVISGEVLSITPSSPLTRSKISIVTADGDVMTFFVRPLTAIYNDKGSFISLTELNLDEKVRVDYKVNKRGYPEAIGIKPVRSLVKRGTSCEPARDRKAKSAAGNDYLKRSLVIEKKKEIKSFFLRRGEYHEIR
jgi:hypothetical protein